MRIKKGVPQHHYTEQEREFLKENSPLMSRQELTDKFNEKFGTSQTKQSIISICSTLKFRCGNDGRFVKGQQSWANGLTKDEWYSHLSEESLARIRKGQYGYGRKRDSGYPVGHELWRNGYLMVKTTDDESIPCNKRWQFKQIIVWEQYHKTKVPKGHIVIFKDGDNTNFSIDNLLMISRKQSSVLAIWNGFNKGELTELYAKSAKLLTLANSKESEEK